MNLTKLHNLIINYIVLRKLIKAIILKYSKINKPNITIKIHK